MAEVVGGHRPPPLRARRARRARPPDRGAADPAASPINVVDPRPVAEVAEKNYSYSDPRRRKVWNFVWLNVLSVGAMLLLFYGVLYGDFLTNAFATSWRWLSRHQVVMALAAS